MDAPTFGDWLDLASQHTTATLIAGGVAVVGLLVLAAISREQRRRSALLTFAASGIALGFSAEGMWEVATGALHLNWMQAILLFAFAELLMLFEADQARQKIKATGDPGNHIRAVWVIAVVAALAAASHADNLSGQFIRFFMPLAVAWQWSSRIKGDRPRADKQESAWIWTPQRVGVRLGLLKPGSVDDLTAVLRQRREDELVALANRFDTASPRRAARLALRLRELVSATDEETLAAAATRYRRGMAAQERLFGRVRVTISDNLTQLGDATGSSETTQAEAPRDARPTQVVDAPVAAPADAPLPTVRQPAQPAVTRIVTQSDALPRRTREVLMRRPISAPPADRDAAMTKALDAVLNGGASIRGAARDADVPEATLRREVNKRREVTQTNGHEFEAVTQ